MRLLRERRERGVRERLEEVKRARGVGEGGVLGAVGEGPVDYEKRIGDGMGRRMGGDK